MTNINNKLDNWSIVVGMEIHAQILSKAKLFSRSSAEGEGLPNANVSYIDFAMPGALPYTNKKCIEQAIKASLALNGTINKVSRFDRKQYFYPDLSSGYQITQFYTPMMEHGFINIKLEDNTKKKIRINRIHIEQDAGKMIHDEASNTSLVDFNRAGVGLLEIVSEPDLSSAEEVATYVSAIRNLLRSINVCDGNMDKGSFRCDINISVKHKNDTEFRNRAEIKNVNSIKFISKAIHYEAQRQIDIWESGKEVEQETRSFKESNMSTVSMRSKVDAYGYRYINEPDLMPIIVTDEEIAKIKSELPELPENRIDRMIKSYDLSDYEADIIGQDNDIAKYYDECAKNCSNFKLISSWVVNNVFSLIKESSKSINELPFNAKDLSDLLNMIDSKKISNNIAKDIFAKMNSTDIGESPENIAKKYDLLQISDTSAIEAAVSSVIADNPEQFTKALEGDKKLIGWLTGQVLAKTKGKANPSIVKEIIENKINNAK